MDLKAETLGLAVIIELPMVIVDVQRAGPSTGMPTKTEQADLLLAMFGRHGESPLPIVAASSPSDCFDAAIEAARIAVRYRTPVILLSDTFLANSSRAVAAAGDRATCRRSTRTSPHPNGRRVPAVRARRTLARPWAVPGTPGLEHRIGGLEREDDTGNISYDPANHEPMTHLRGGEGGRHRRRHPAARGRRPDGDAELLVLGWGSSLGAIRAAAARVRGAGRQVAAAHLRHLNPFPREHRRGRPPLPQGADPRDEPRASSRC